MGIRSNILGIDIGSVSISMAEMTAEKRVVKTAYAFHHGNITEKLKKLFNQFDLRKIGWVASTSSTPSILKASQQYDNRISVIAATRHFHSSVGSILIVGGEKFGLIRFDHRGNYLGFKANTSCAAGTGSFLDQQAHRLHLNGTAELGEIASGNTEKIPKIASRCAVFAKTDLAHAQQEGYSLAAICDGLCFGLAKNVVDTLFAGLKPETPVIFTGGVSKIRAVVKHIQSMINKEVIVEKYPYGAVGAALNLADELDDRTQIEAASPDDIIIERPIKKKLFFNPLQLQLSEYPDFSSLERYEYTSDLFDYLNPVEVDIYEGPERFYDEEGICEAFLGIDIGSTSTKAVLMNKSKIVLAGFYTRTAGRPVNAIQNIFASINDLIKRKKYDLKIINAGTTGSGRKLSGKLIGADLVIDEITAHARAAVEINPDVDTIMEIGGQDSKFTTLKNGMVTFSNMNAVCAAGTGSFIEEQAKRLGCPLSEYSDRTRDQRSPITSERCTVFMERDINHYLSRGYTKEELLASVLHSVRENYISKVAVENYIGGTILFQGATAKNRALIAAFEQRLGKTIHVSRFCHLTGAFGAALMLSETPMKGSFFKGLDICKKSIPIRTEVCEYCANHCKITVAEVDGEHAAYGFLCGRDYDIKGYVDNNRSGFDLVKERERLVRVKPAKEYREDLTIGIPAALHMHEDLPFWKTFFEALSVKTVTSEGYGEALKEGKSITGAEFCAPITALHGHVKYLLERSDFIFLPFYLDNKFRRDGGRRQYCYYTQFAPSLASAIRDDHDDTKTIKNRLLTPLVHYIYSHFHTRVQLYRMMKNVSNRKIDFLKVSHAYDRAWQFKKSRLLEMKKLYDRYAHSEGEFHVMFLGRPYSILSKQMNKGIPDIFSSMGVKTFFQDMLECSEQDTESIRPLLNELHWHYAAEIMKAAEKTAQTQGAYPVLVTSFKCSPDSFIIEYFKQLMESHDKPYLILQIDEHDSSVGYETRIEAAIRSFRNHFSSIRTNRQINYVPALVPARERRLGDKTLIIPNWDNLSLSLVVANLQKEGIDARLLKESDAGIQKSLRHNTGQCIPLNIIAQEFMDYIDGHRLDPADTVLWMIASILPCNLGLFPHHIKNILASHGKGFEKAGVYAGAMSLGDLSMRLPVNTYFAYMFGGYLKKMGCRIRPYEKHAGTTDAVIRKSLDLLTDAFLGNRNRKDAVAEVVSSFEAIEKMDDYHSFRKPKVGIFGDLYARDNEVINEGLIHRIEEYGGEVVPTPYSSYIKMVAKPYLRKWFVEGDYLDALSSKALIAAVTQMEKKYCKYFRRVLEEPEPSYNESPEEILSLYNIRIENTGESMENLLKFFM